MHCLVPKVTSMNEKEYLLSRLRALAQVDWTIAALAALSERQVVFAGQVSHHATNSAADLMRIYEIRLGHCISRGINAVGLPELLDALARVDPGATIAVQPFRGSGKSVTAFLGQSGELIGCVTIPWDRNENGAAPNEMGG
jgi:hypothetical protein